MTLPDPPPSSAEHLRNLLEFEGLISELSSRFINLPPGDLDREIEDALRRVSEAVGLDLAILWQWDGEGRAIMAPTHAYYVHESLRPTEPLRQEHFPWFIQQMLAGRAVAVSSLEEFPPEADIDRESCRVFGVKSNLTLPLLVAGQRPVGALGLNAEGCRRRARDELRDPLRPHQEARNSATGVGRTVPTVGTNIYQEYTWLPSEGSALPWHHAPSQPSSFLRISHLGHHGPSLVPLWHGSGSSFSVTMGTVRFVPPSNRRADVLEILRSVQGPVRAQPGCAAFDIYDERGPDSAVLLVERWETDAALEAHLRSEIYRSILCAIELSGERTEVRFEHVSDSQGIELIERTRSASGGPDVGRSKG